MEFKIYAVLWGGWVIYFPCCSLFPKYVMLQTNSYSVVLRRQNFRWVPLFRFAISDFYSYDSPYCLRGVHSSSFPSYSILRMFHTNIVFPITFTLRNKLLRGCFRERYDLNLIKSKISYLSSLSLSFHLFFHSYHTFHHHHFKSNHFPRVALEPCIGSILVLKKCCFFFIFAMYWKFDLQKSHVIFVKNAVGNY